MMSRMGNPLYKPRPERWLTWRFSLKTGFVLLTLICVSLGWSVNQARQREATLRRLTGRVILHTPESRSFAGSAKKVPWMSSQLGAQPVCGIFLPAKTPEEERRRVRQLFPEATIVIDSTAAP
jgi:hypothetical protein